MAYGALYRSHWGVKALGVIGNKVLISLSLPRALQNLNQSKLITGSSCLHHSQSESHLSCQGRILNDSLMLLSFSFNISSRLLQISLENKRTHTPQCSAPAAQPEFERMTFIKRSAGLAGWSVHIDLCFSVSLLCRSHPKRPSSCCQSVITAISAVNKRAEYLIHSRLSTSAPYCIVKCAVKWKYPIWPLKMTF